MIQKLTTEISLFLYQNELDTLELLPGTLEELVEAAIKFHIENPGVQTGAWGKGSGSPCIAHRVPTFPKAPGV